MKAIVTLTGIATIVIGTIAANIDTCSAIGRCKKLGEGKPACELIEGEWDEKRNCCRVK